MRYVLIILAAVSSVAQADSIDELRQENRKLAERLQRLEQADLERDVEGYLTRTEAAPGAEGADSIVPEGMRLRVSGEVRAREEILDSVYSPMDPGGQRSFDFAHLRTRLRFDVDLSDHVGIVIEFQDVRNFGGAGSTTAVTGGVDVKRAMMLFKDVGGSGIDVEVGRFVMFYGDHRVIGHLEWVDQGRTYDGVRAGWKADGDGKGWLDFFAVRVRETLQPADDQELVGVYGGWGPVELYALVLHDGLGRMGELAIGDTLFTTVGVRFSRKTDSGFDYTVEALFQGGDVNGDNLSAFGAVIVVGYTFADTSWKPRVALEAAWASGDENPGDGDVQQLQTLFPTNHLHYGYADLVAWSNILDIRVRVTAQPTEQITLSLDFHHFRRPEELGAWVNAGGAVIRPGAAGTSSELGNEVDFTLVWKPSGGVSFLIGYSIFLPGGFVSQTGADPTAHFGYVQARVKF